MDKKMSSIMYNSIVRDIYLSIIFCENKTYGYDEDGVLHALNRYIAPLVYTLILNNSEISDTVIHKLYDIDKEVENVDLNLIMLELGITALRGNTVSIELDADTGYITGYDSDGAVIDYDDGLNSILVYVASMYNIHGMVKVEDLIYNFESTEILDTNLYHHHMENVRMKYRQTKLDKAIDKIKKLFRR